MAADESNRPRAVKVGGDDGHERKIFSYRASGFTKRSAARRHDRFPRGRRGSTDLPDGAGIWCIASGRHGCGQPSRDGGLCFARASTRTGKPGAGHVTTNSDGASYYVGAAIENSVKNGDHLIGTSETSRPRQADERQAGSTSPVLLSLADPTAGYQLPATNSYSFFARAC